MSPNSQLLQHSSIVCLYTFNPHLPPQAPCCPLSKVINSGHVNFLSYCVCTYSVNPHLPPLCCPRWLTQVPAASGVWIPLIVLILIIAALTRPCRPRTFIIFACDWKQPQSIQVLTRNRSPWFEILHIFWSIFILFILPLILFTNNPQQWWEFLSIIPDTKPSLVPFFICEEILTTH